MRLLAKKIIGLLLIPILFLTQVTPVHAIFSPSINNTAIQAKGHVFQSRQVNGVFDAEDIVRESGDFANTGLYYFFFRSLAQVLIDGITKNYTLGFALLIGIYNGKSISTCLRDDVWELQALQEEIINELFKSALLGDLPSATTLWNDYQMIDEVLYGNRHKQTKLFAQETDGMLIDFAITEYWFPEGTNNYYVNCPYGEFTQAFREVANSFENLKTSFGASTPKPWGAIPEIAQKRAKQQAAQWIAANQIKLSFGGEQGGNPTSLMSGAGLKSAFGELSTAKEFTTNLVDLGSGLIRAISPETKALISTEKEFLDAYYELAVTESLAPVTGRYIDETIEFFSGDSADISQRVTAEEKLLAINIAARENGENAIKYKLSLTNVNEQGLIEIDRALFKVHKEVERAYKTDTAPDNLMLFCNQLQLLSVRQCPNHRAETPTCR